MTAWRRRGFGLHELLGILALFFIAGAVLGAALMFVIEGRG
jgi:hypothetical protein